jgi:hypothetical protein
MDASGQKVRKRGYSGARLELIKKAASLSLEEYTIPEIARELRVSDSKLRRLLAASEGLPASYLTETAQVARLLDLHRLDGLLTVAFPVALGQGSAIDEQSDARNKTSLRERFEAMRIVMDVIKQRAKLLRYEGVPAQD